jgi:hypothetical protein
VNPGLPSESCSGPAETGGALINMGCWCRVPFDLPHLLFPKVRVEKLMEALIAIPAGVLWRPQHGCVPWFGGHLITVHPQAKMWTYRLLVTIIRLEVGHMGLQYFHIR